MTSKNMEAYYEPTMNQQGFMLKKLDPFAYKFLDFLGSDTSGLPALDIGAAYGIVTLEAHKRGHAIIANDLSSEHLSIMKKRAHDMGLPSISTMPGDFFDLPLQNNSLSAIYVSRVLHFLSGEGIIKALKLFYNWLAPGGKLFAINETPFFGTAISYTQST